MQKHAAVKALVIALITMLAPAVSNAAGAPLHEVDCDSWAHGMRLYAARCHCGLECGRQYSYTVTVPCLSKTPPFCDKRVVLFEAARACFAKCVAAKTAAQHLDRNQTPLTEWWLVAPRSSE
jgi:hypothetical protein